MTRSQPLRLALRVSLRSIHNLPRSPHLPVVFLFSIHPRRVCARALWSKFLVSKCKVQAIVLPFWVMRGKQAG